MSHFLRKNEVVGPTHLGKPRAMAKVKVEGKKGDVFLEIVPEFPGIAKSDTQIVQLPERVKVREPGGKKIVKPSKGASFWVTIETIDPYHGVIEIPADWRFGIG